MNRRRCFVARWAWFIAVALLSTAVDAAERPNVILIMSDDYGYECVAANGGTSYQTPHLDELARTGMRFERCYAQPLCTPTRVQLMTGQYNLRNYVRFGLLDPKQQTFAHWFRAAGYATCIVGKWQLGGGFDGPKHFGFDEYCLWQLTRRPPRYANPGLEINGREFDYTKGEYGPDLVNEYLLDFVERNRDKPFLAYYPLMPTHSPYEPTPDVPEYDRSVTGPENGRKIADKKHFADMVAYQDKLIGKLVAKLDSLHLRERTLILFTGDNGTGRGVTSRLGEGTVEGGKGTTTEAGMHVPLIVNWPGKIPAGHVESDLVDMTDFAPTMLDAAGIARPREWQLDGHSFWPQLQGQPGKPRDWVYSWYAPDGGKEDDAAQFVIGPRLKLYRDGRVFDVLADPTEKKPRQESLSTEEKTTVESYRQVFAQYAGARPAWTLEKRNEKNVSTPKKKKSGK